VRRRIQVRHGEKMSLGDLGELQIASECLKRYLGLEASRMVPAGSFHHHYSFRSV
jgi:hypothetical protein